MFTAQPLLDREQVFLVYKPGEPGAHENAFRLLKSKGFVSPGIQAVLRNTRTGRLSGRLWLYSALNRDALRLLRRGHRDEARRLAKKAELLERSQRLQRLASAYAAARSDLEPVFAWRQLTASQSSLLVQVAEATQRARNAVMHGRQPSEEFYGRVSRITASFAEVKGPGGPALVLPLSELRERSLAEIGVAVAVFIEHLGAGQSLFQTEPALVLDEGEDSDGLPDGMSRLDFSRVRLSDDGATLEELLPEATIAVPVPLS